MTKNKFYSSNQRAQYNKNCSPFLNRPHNIMNPHVSIEKFTNQNKYTLSFYHVQDVLTQTMFLFLLAH